MTRNEILQLASKLPDAELAKLIAGLQALLGTGTASVVSKDEEDVPELYHALNQAMYRAKKAYLPPLKIVKGNKQRWNKFLEATKVFEQFLGELERDRVKKLALRKYLCSLIIDYAERHRMGLLPGTLIYLCGNIQLVFDSYFPGYQSTGMLPKVLSLIYGGTKRKLQFAHEDKKRI